MVNKNWVIFSIFSQFYWHFKKKKFKSQKYLDFYGQKYLDPLNIVKNGLNNNNYGKFWPNWTFEIKKFWKNWKKMTPTKIFKLQLLRPDKGFRPPLKGYLAKITYIFRRNNNFWKFSKFELSRSNFPRKTHFSGASCVALFWPTIFLASPNGGKKTLFYSFFHFWTKKIPPPF